MPIAVALRSREHGSLVGSILVIDARVRSAPTWGPRHQIGYPAPSGLPSHGVNLRQRGYRDAFATPTCPVADLAGSAGSRQVTPG